jgi:hypothetical protein
MIRPYVSRLIDGKRGYGLLLDIFTRGTAPENYEVCRRFAVYRQTWPMPHTRIEDNGFTGVDGEYHRITIGISRQGEMEWRIGRDQDLWCTQMPLHSADRGGGLPEDRTQPDLGFSVYGIVRDV